MNRCNWQSVAWVVVAGLLLASIGCKGGGTSGPPTVKVTGVVTQKGQPVDGALVTFAPTQGSSGFAAAGTTDASGRFTLTTQQPGDGAVASTYQVGISKMSAAAGPPKVDTTGMTPDQANDAVAKARDEFLKSGKKEEPPKELLPRKYTSPATSGLTAEVSETSKEFNFDLE